MKLTSLISSAQVRYTILAVSKDEQFIKVKSSTTGVEKDFQKSWLKKMHEEGKIIEHDDDTFSFVKEDRKIEY